LPFYARYSQYFDRPWFYGALDPKIVDRLVESIGRAIGRFLASTIKQYLLYAHQMLKIIAPTDAPIRTTADRTLSNTAAL